VVEIPRGAIQIRAPKLDTAPPAESVNWFNMSFVGSEVQLSTGFLDLHEIAVQIAQRAPNVPVTPLYLGRYVMSLASFALLRHQVEELSKRMKDAGIDIESIRPSITAK
jgi:hypothetical protein